MTPRSSPPTWRCRKANANELAGQWFGIPKSSGYYAEVAQGLTLSTGIAEVTMTSTVKSAPNTTIDGTKVEVLKGMSVKSSLEASFKEALYFTYREEAASRRGHAERPGFSRDDCVQPLEREDRPGRPEDHAAPQLNQAEDDSAIGTSTIGVIEPPCGAELET